MNVKRTKLPFTGIAVALAMAFSLMPMQVAYADYLQWATTTLKTGSMETGYSFAKTALRDEGATNIKSSPTEVTGTIGKTYVVITCVATTPHVTAVVMVIGGDSDETAKVRDKVKKKIAGIIKFD